MGLFDKLLGKNRESERDKNNIFNPGKTNKDEAERCVQRAKVIFDIKIKLEMLDQAIMLDPNYPDPWFYKAKTYQGIGDYNNALLCYRSAAKLGDPRAHDRIVGIERKIQRRN